MQNSRASPLPGALTGPVSAKFGTVFARQIISIDLLYNVRPMCYPVIMSKKKNTKSLIITSQQQFDLDKPRYNAHQTGHGAHKNKKAYTRKAKHRYAE